MNTNDIISDVKIKLNQLKKESNYEDLTDTIERNRKDTIKQKVVDLFSFILPCTFISSIILFHNRLVIGSFSNSLHASARLILRYSYV